MLVVVTLDKTVVFHSALVASTTAVNAVPGGISSWTCLQAFCVEIHEIPTRDVTTSSWKAKSPPTRVDAEVEDAEPLSCLTLPCASVPIYVALLTGSASKYPPGIHHRQQNFPQAQH